MLRNISESAGRALAAQRLVSTLAVAQGQSSSQPIPPARHPAVHQEYMQPPSPAQPRPAPQNLTCTRDNGKGDCVAAAGADCKEIVVVGEGLERGETMACVDMGNVVQCKPTRG